MENEKGGKIANSRIKGRPIKLKQTHDEQSGDVGIATSQCSYLPRLLGYNYAKYACIRIIIVGSDIVGMSAIRVRHAHTIGSYHEPRSLVNCVKGRPTSNVQHERGGTSIEHCALQ